MSYEIVEAQLPVRLKFERPMSDADLLRFCEANEDLRVERDANGEILVMSPASSNTSKMNMRISRYLDEWAEVDDHGIGFDSSGGFTLPDNSMRSPDAAWILRKRWDCLTKEQQSSFAPVCPNFVIELRSPSDKLPEVQSKMQQWISNGTELAWLIDPERRVVEIYRPGNSVEQLDDPSSVQGSSPVAGFELVMARIWD